MRALLPLALLAAIAIAEPLVVVARIAPDGAAPCGLAPVSRETGGRLGFVRPRDRAFDVQTLGVDGRAASAFTNAGEPVGLCFRDSQPCVLVRKPGGVALLRAGGRRGSVVEWPVDLRGAEGIALLAFQSDDAGYDFVATDGPTLYLGGFDLQGRARAQFLSKPGKRFVAATEGFLDVDGDGRVEAFALTEPFTIVRLVRNPRGDYEVTQDYAVRADARFSPRSIAVAPGELWVGGARGDDSMLVRLDPQASPAVHKFKDIFEDDSTGKRDPVSSHAFGKGSIEFLRVLDDAALVAGGTREGRSWVGVLDRRNARVLHETYLQGAAVRRVAVNPARAGWSLAALGDDGTVTLLRIAGDAGAPSPPPSLPNPGRDDVFERGRDSSAAVFPWVASDRNRDTTIYALNLGAQELSLTFRFLDAEGRLVGEHAGRLAPGRRAAFDVSRVVRGNFDGYLVIEGGRETTLVLEAHHRTQSSELVPLRPHWR